MRIYISGKISDLLMLDVERKFTRAEQRLRDFDYIPVNPLVHISVPDGATWGEAMIEDLKELLTCKAIYMLPDWYDSPGARIEHDFAKRLGLHVIYEEQFINEKE